ncbi:MAG: DUF255 domain-containing protein [Chitinophagales bacterium]
MKKIIFISFLFFTAMNAAAQVNFQPLTWDDATQKSAAAGKYIFMDCFTDWCGWCRVMDKEVFTDSKVSGFINDHFIAVKTDMEKGEGILVSLKYRVNGYPAYLIFDQTGNLVYTITGYSPVDKFLASLNESVDPEKQTVYKGISRDLNLVYPDFCLKFIDGRKRNWPDSAVVISYLEQQTDLSTEVNWTVLSLFGYRFPKYSQIILENQEKYSNLYGINEVSSVVKNNIIGSKLNYAIKNLNEAELNSTLQMVDQYVKDDAALSKLYYRISFYLATRNYSKMMNTLDELAATHGYGDVDEYNSCCWEIYEKSDDPELIRRAVIHMEKAVLAVKGYAQLDTYAALLFKDKQFEKAEKIADEAITMGKEKDQDVSSTEALLEKIKIAKGG